jgi:hypothetical protein
LIPKVKFHADSFSDQSVIESELIVGTADLFQLTHGRSMKYIHDLNELVLCYDHSSEKVEQDRSDSYQFGLPSNIQNAIIT